MKGGGNDWLKLYTGLLEHDGFCAMDDSARMLVVALWLYAARSGLHIFPADPAWLARKIPMLNGKPDLEPLLDAMDCYGEPTPFIRYCPYPKARKGSKSRPATGTGSKSGKARSTPVKTKKSRKEVLEATIRKRREESRGEERRRREIRNPNGLRERREEREKRTGY